MSDPVSTPDGRDFSVAAKLYICSGRVLPQGGGLFFWSSPTGVTISSKTLAEGLIITTLDWLNENGWIQIWETEVKQLFVNVPVLGVRALHSGAPGFAGRLLESTGWQDSDVMQMTSRFIGHRSEDPKMAILAAAEREFEEAGVCLSGTWNKEWLDYLAAAWHTEAAQWYAHAMAQPWAETARRNAVAGIGARLQSRDDD